ncbi:hypothetical protein ACFFWC_20995 [Plantactinospora siamensis]|uniref:Uncharacterized protein n=1 Tax=Plantactinospora siamensis TaxID=555372 RepID=A0ABV6NS62_9ACTN
MTRRWAVRLAAALVPVGAWLVATGGPVAAAGPDTVRIDAPGFAAGRTAIVAAVASTTADGDCRKVRWSMLLRVAGMRPEQVRVQRFEDNGDFAVQVRADGNTTRFTDRALDPGVLCRGRTDTARYRLTFAADVVDAQVTLQADALDENGRPLARAAVTRDVPATGVAAPTPPDRGAPPPATAGPSGAPTAAAEETGTGPAPDPAATAAAAPPAGGTGGDVTGTGRRDAVSLLGGISAVQLAFLIGGLLLFLGVGLLLRMRHLIGSDREPEFAGMGPGMAGGRRRRGRR